MDKSFLLQQQIRNNSEDLQKEVLDLKAWEQEMKRKDAELRLPDEQVLPPIRKKKLSKVVAKIGNKTEKATTSSHRIKSYDYSSWEKFDVDKACEEVDKKDKTEEVDTEMTPDELERSHNQANELKIKGNIYVRKQEWKKALDCYTKAIEIFSYDATFFANRALCCLKLNNFYSAEADSTVALQLDTTYVKAYHRRAQARVELKQYHEAKQDIEKLLELEPSNKEGRSMLLQVNQAISNQKGVVISEVPVDKSAIEKKIGEQIVRTKKVQEIKPNKSETVTKRHESDKKNLPSWLPDYERDYEIVQPVRKQPHQRLAKPMKKVAVTEINFGVHALSKSIKQLQAEIKSEISTSKCKVDSVEVNESEKKSERCLIQVISEAESLNNDTEIPPVPKTLVQFLSSWNKTKTSTFRYKYLQQLSPSSLPELFKEFLEFDTLNEILQTLNKEFTIRKQPVYYYLYYLSQVKRFRAVTLFLSADDKKVVEHLLEYAKSFEKKTDEQIAELRERYEL